MYSGQDEYNIKYVNERSANHHKIKGKNVILCEPNPTVSHYYKTFSSVPPFLFSWKYYLLMGKKKLLKSDEIRKYIYKIQTPLYTFTHTHTADPLRVVGRLKVIYVTNRKRYNSF